MPKLFAISVTLALAVLHVPLAEAAAQSPAPAEPCINLVTQALQEQSVTGSDGKTSTRWVPATKVVPGDSVIWETTARNRCAAAAGNVVINQAVPQHMTLVANSVSGTDTRIVYSLDGASFLPLNELTVTEADGSRRPARAEEVRHLRWLLNGSIGGNQSLSVRYSARLQ